MRWIARRTLHILAHNRPETSAYPGAARITLSARNIASTTSSTRTTRWRIDIWEERPSTIDIREERPSTIDILRTKMPAKKTCPFMKREDTGVYGDLVKLSAPPSSEICLLSFLFEKKPIGGGTKKVPPPPIDFKKGDRRYETCLERSKFSE